MDIKRRPLPESALAARRTPIRHQSAPDLRKTALLQEQSSQFNPFPGIDASGRLVNAAPGRETFPLAQSSSSFTEASDVSAAGSQIKEKSIWQTAFDETKYFAGGLMSHPFEFTRHYTILRHSGGLVWYRGPSTTVTITIFSDSPLPPTRSIWLQRKGFSGNMGMNLESLMGATTSWLDVTPSAEAAVTDMIESDERGCQRDIKKFLKKAPRELRKHLAQETHVVRIPAAANDGYFRLLLCTGDEGKKKVLCPSPVFRVASTSTDPSIMRGASLSTMPLELGVKVGSTIATNVVSKYIAPVTMVVQGRLQKFQPGFVTQHAGRIAYGTAAVKNKVQEMEGHYHQHRDGSYGVLQAEETFESPPEVIGHDSGPLPPFPVKFDGKVNRGTGRGGMELGIPTANLSEVREDVKLRMKGVFFGWACVPPKKGLESMSHDWHESIITIMPSPYANAKIVTKNVVVVNFIHEFGGVTFFDARVKVILMGHLRQARLFSDISSAQEAYSHDVLLAVASLSRDNWGPQETVERLKTLKSERSFTDKYSDARGKVQMRVDKIPLHLAGVRTDGATARDQAFGNGGLWIRR